MAVSEKDAREAAKLVKRVVRAESIDEEALRALKQFARRSDPHVQAVFASVWDHLGASNALERLLALQLCAHSASAAPGAGATRECGGPVFVAGGRRIDAALLMGIRRRRDRRQFARRRHWWPCALY